MSRVPASDRWPGGAVTHATGCGASGGRSDTRRALLRAALGVLIPALWPGLPAHAPVAASVTGSGSAGRPTAGGPPPPALRFGIVADVPPLAFTEAGVLRGLAVDLAQALATDLGVDLQLQALPQRRIVEALRGGRIDVALSALADDELQALGLAPTGTLLETGQMALVRAGDLPRFGRELDVLLVAGPVGYEVASAGARFVHERLPHAERVPFPSAAAGIAALQRDEIALFIHDAPTVWAATSSAPVFAAGGPADLAGIYRPLTRERLTWVVRAEDALLQRQIGTLVQDWTTSRRLQTLLNRWIPVQVQVSR